MKIAAAAAFFRQGPAGGEMTSDSAQNLAGRRILIVEDEYYIADDLARALGALGAEVIGPVASPDQAHALLDAARPDFAILDMNLKGESGIPIGERLQGEGVPFVLASGYSGPAIPEQFRGVPRVEKPFDAEAVAECVRALLRETRPV